MSEQVLSALAGGFVGGIIFSLLMRLWLALPIERTSNGESVVDIMREFNERQRIENETWKTTSHTP